MIRKSTSDDWPAVQDFLAPRVATSMFLSGNLRDHGLNATGASKATTVWLSEEEGRITNVFGLAEAGYFVFEAPAFRAEMAAPLRQVLAGWKFIGVNGAAPQAEALIAALRLDESKIGFSEALPHFSLKPGALIVPEGRAQLRPMQADDVPLVTDWRHGYDIDIFGSGDLPESRKRSVSQAEELVNSGRGRILVEDGEPVAMTAFNAVLPDIVQVGGVYTPPELRGRGYARRAVALHLSEARAQGQGQAILFASGAAAARAYEAIGFEKIGDYRVIDFTSPVYVEAGP